MHLNWNLVWFCLKILLPKQDFFLEVTRGGGGGLGLLKYDSGRDVPLRLEK